MQEKSLTKEHFNPRRQESRSIQIVLQTKYPICTLFYIMTLLASLIYSKTVNFKTNKKAVKIIV